MHRYLRLLFAASILALFLAGVSPVLAANCYFWEGIGEYVCDSEAKPAAASPFVTPVTPEDTLFGHRWYGRLADYTNVYSEPIRTSAVVRNVGDGYLFATVKRWFDNDAGEKWYEINHNEYVHEDDLTLVEPATFQGVEVLQQPQRPFGWVVQAVTPSHEPDGEPDELFAELPRYTFVQIYDVKVGNEDWLWYDIGDGRWVRQTFFSIVDVNPRPEGVGKNEFWTEVDLYEQTFAAYEGDRMVYATLISSGLNRWPTREGLFQVWDRFYEYKMSGAEGQVDYYFLEDIPYIMYFDEKIGAALHGTYWHDRFGFKHSHGCVNMPIKDAEWTFNWSADAPNDLWVWVHTSDPYVHLEQNE
ncbi:MAG: hypothetical protein CL608_03780 [Anaerolineaceae bacterium]|nr:hypothetical protein [Anaerolineaceae bacterium]